MKHYKWSISRLGWGKKFYLYGINWLPMMSWVKNMLILCKTTVTSRLGQCVCQKQNKKKLKNKIFFPPTYCNFFAKETGNRTIFCFGLTADILDTVNSRAEASASRLAELNPYVTVNTLTTGVSHDTDLSYLLNYQVSFSIYHVLYMFPWAHLGCMSVTCWRIDTM